MDDTAGDIAAHIIGSQEMLRRRRPKYAGEADLIGGISNRWELRPISFLKVARNEVFERDVLKLCFPSCNAQPGDVIFQNGKVNHIPILHNERLVIGDEISESREYE